MNEKGACSSFDRQLSVSARIAARERNGQERRGERRAVSIPKGCRLHAKVRMSWTMFYLLGWVGFAVAGQSVLCEGFSASMGKSSTK